MSSLDIEFVGLKELRKAVKRNPTAVNKAGKRFLQRGLARYKKTIISRPWRLGAAGGGAPVNTGNLRDTHRTTINGLVGTIKPTAKYAPYVHGIKGFPRTRTYQLRPWLDYAKEVNTNKIIALEKELLKEITQDLAK